MSAQPPTVAQLLSSNATSIAQIAGNVASSLVGDMALVFIYVAFLIASASAFSNQLDQIFKRQNDRTRARLIGQEIRHTMEQYLWVQTALSIVSTLLTYVTLLIVGLVLFLGIHSVSIVAPAWRGRGLGQAVTREGGPRRSRFWRRWLQIVGCALLVSAGSMATTPAELQKALDEALASGKPTLINAIIDETAGTESGRITSLNPTAAKKK